MPADLVLFAVIIGSFFVVGIPMILRNVRVPAELEIDEVPEGELDQNQMDFFAPWDDRLALIGYRPELNCRVTNLQCANLVRGYFSASQWWAISLPDRVARRYERGRIPV